jgi:hypothetical protein
MLPLGHVAYTWGALRWLQDRGRARNVDYRWAAAAALLPDVLDKPLSLTLFRSSGTSQGLAHTLLGHLVATAAVARWRPELLPYALISHLHLVQDQMWKYPKTLLFPLLGRFEEWRFMGSPAAMLDAYAEIVSRPQIVALELLGLAILRRTLSGRDLAALVRTGQLEGKP